MASQRFTPARQGFQLVVYGYHIDNSSISVELSDNELNLWHRMDIDTPVSKETCISVPMALGKHLFSFRTQKLSPAAAIILRKWETSTVPNYTKYPGKPGFLFNSIFTRANDCAQVVNRSIKPLMLK